MSATPAPPRPPTAIRLGLLAAGLTALAAVFPAFVPAVSAAGFLLIPGVPGESTDPAHTNWIELASFHSPQPGPSAVGTPARRPSAGSLRITKLLDRASPILARAFTSPDRVGANAELEFTRRVSTSQTVFYRVVLGNPRVVACESQADAAGGTPVESVEFAFDSVSWTYTTFSESTGRALAIDQARWDFLRNTGDSSSKPLGVTVRSVTQADGRLGVQWTPEPGRRYTLARSFSPEGPYVPVTKPEAAPSSEPRWIELPGGPAFAFFQLLEEE